MNLTESQRIEIEKAVDELFFTLKAKILGRFFTGPKIFFEIVRSSSPLESIEGIFRYTYQMLNPGSEPDEKQIKSLAMITGNYVEAERLKTKNRILIDVQSAKTVDDVDKLVKENIDKATLYIDMLVNNEARVVQSYAEKSGIAQVAASMGIDDPTVFKVGVIDDRMCKNCRKLWHTKENIHIPKVYKMSELAEGYMKDWRNPYPTIVGSHPRCRHVLTLAPPSFGFGASGQIEFKGFGYDVYADQHGTEKSEQGRVVDNALDLESFFDFPTDDGHTHGA